MASALPVLVNQSSLQPQTAAIVRGIIHQFTVGLGPVLHSLYLAGSVVRGCAVAGCSDVNITLVVMRDLTPNEQSTIQAIARRAEQQQRFFPHVSVQWVSKQTATSLHAIFEWGFWLKHCCCCVYGDDLSTRFGCFEASWDIARAQNGDIAQQLDDYRHKIMKTQVLSHYLAYCRDIAKKMIWSAYALTFHRSGQWVWSIEEAAELFLTYYPDKSLNIERLFILLSGQQVPKKAVLFMINDFGRWVVTEFDKIDRKIG
ncbi:nucleotidyltransferase domain-containing protein [Photobacterium japonica]|uniref:nucleotidyltransferase domain-containing protein n=1 Tax=Photobacterium japonica TaxID=2910235 RepID=UPI003D0D62CC